MKHTTPPSLPNVPVRSSPVAGPPIDAHPALGAELLYPAGPSSALTAPVGFVYFLAAPGAPEACAPRTPVTYRNVDVYRIDASGAFDLSSWQGQAGTAYRVSAEAGVLSSTQPGGAIY